MRKPIRPLQRRATELARMLNSLSRRHSMERLFRDWVEMSALAISNRVDLAQYQPREERYMQIVKQYSKDEAHNMAEMYALFAAELDLTRECVFGPLLAKLELGSKSAQKWLGQFFSPWHLCYMMAKMTVGDKDDVQKMIGDRGFFTAMEPACGAGAM